MEIDFSEQAREDLIWWKNSGNKKAQKKISELLSSIVTTPFEGVGKPEPLKYNLAGTWSRRINSEHRIVYEMYETVVYIISMKGHYNA